MVKNGAGVACIPELRAALRLKAYEARPDAFTGPSNGGEGSMRLFGVGFDAPAKADHGSLVQERQAAKQTDALVVL